MDAPGEESLPSLADRLSTPPPPPPPPQDSWDAQYSKDFDDEPFPERLSFTLTASTKANTSTPVSSGEEELQLPNSAPVHKSTFLTMKAHRFSSMKKKKLSANTLLQKIFCSSPNSGEVENNANDSCQGGSSNESNEEITAKNSDEENRSPQLEKAATNLLHDETASSCSGTFGEAFELAKESLKLEGEGRVRNTIQASLRDVGASVMEACTSTQPEHHSPPTISGKFEKEDNGPSNESRGVPPTPEMATPIKPMKTPGGLVIPTPFTALPSTITGFGNNSASASRSPLRTRMDDGKPELRSSLRAVPKRSVSLDDRDCEAVKSPLRLVRSTETGSDHVDLVSRLHSESQESNNTSESGDTARTVHLSPFQQYQRKFEAMSKRDITTSSRAHRRTPEDDPLQSLLMTLSDSDEEGKLSAVQEVSASRETSSKDESTIRTDQTVANSTKDVDDDAFLPDDFKAGLRLAPRPETPRRYTWGEVEQRISQAVEMAKEEWKAIWGVQIRKEIEEEQELKLQQTISQCKSEADQLLQEHGRQWKAEQDMELKIVKSKFERRIHELKDQAALANQQAKARQAEVDAMESELKKIRSMEARDAEIEELQKKLREVENERTLERERFERELTEMKEKHSKSSDRSVKSAPTMNSPELKRVKKTLEEVNAKLSEKEREASKESAEVQRLKKELKGVKSELSKKKELSIEFERVKSELSSVREKLSSKEKELEQASSLLPELHQVKIELADATERLAQRDSEHSKAELMSSLESVQKELESLKSENSQKPHIEDNNVENEEVQKLRKELEEVKNKLSSKDNKSPKTTPSRNGPQTQRLRKELEEVKEKLAAKEAELLELRNSRRLSTPSRRGTSPSHTPNRQPRSTPGGSGIKKTPSRPGTGRKSTGSANLDSLRQELEQLHEKEKESLRLQIETLEEQARQSNQEHERALNELRMAGEQEIFRVRKEMEERVEMHMARERELKETLSDVSSWEKEELLEKIERLEAQKKEDRNGGLREVQKKEDLLQRISALEKREKEIMGEHERVMQDLRSESDAEIQRLRAEMERREEELLAREKELELAISETSSFEKEELIKKIEDLEAQLESEKNSSILVKMKITAIEKEMQAAERVHEEALMKLRDSSNDEINRLKTELSKLILVEDGLKTITCERDSLKAELSKLTSIEDGLKTITCERDNMKAELSKLTSMQDELKTITCERDRLKGELSKLNSVEDVLKTITCERDNLQGELSKLRSQIELERSQYHHKLEELRKRHEEETDQARKEASALLFAIEKETSEKLVLQQKVAAAATEELMAKHAEQISRLQQELKEKELELKEEYEIIHQKSSGEDNELRQQIASLMDRAEAEKNYYQTLVKEIQDNHTKELDEVLAQLDLVEAEHKEHISEKDKSIIEKDTIITVLGSQLAEAKSTTEKASAELITMTQEIRKLKSELEHSETEVAALKEALEKAKTSHQKYVKQAETLKEKACQEARQDMIQHAKAQFDSANVVFQKLKKEHDGLKIKTEKLEKELRATRKKVEEAEKAKEHVEVDLKAEIAQLKASQARTEADAAQKAKEYRREMERLLQATKDFEARRVESEETCHNLQKSLASIVSEKTKLQEEYNDMKSVCEELMAMVEGQQQ